MERLIEVKDLVKYYGKVKAVDGVGFSVREGDCFGLLGPNGAGKTTTIEIMESIQKPDSGEILYKGDKISRAFKEKVGIQFQHTALQQFLTVRETLKLFSRLYKKANTIEKVIKLCSLGDIIDRDNSKLSGGQRQRMLLAIALVNDPELLFLDEPTTGLDPNARRNFWELIRGIKKEGKTIILTTHYMDEAENLCDEIVVMDHGKIIEHGNPMSLLEKHFGKTVLRLPEGAFPEKFELSCPYEKRDKYVRVNCSSINQAINELVHNGISLENLAVEHYNLDDLFLRLTGSSLD